MATPPLERPASQAEPEVDRLRRRNRKLTALLDVAKALTAEHSLENILDLILRESVKTVDADRASLFIVDRVRNQLWSKIAQGLESHQNVETRIIRLPIGTGSIAGTVAHTGRPLNIPDAYQDARFNRGFDDATGYRTATILCVPMLGTKQQVVGVVQALNHRNGPFTEEDEELLMALGANAAAAIENANLYEDIEKLFEGFVQASVTAIEARDPTTSGHSGRVAELSVVCLDMLPRSGGEYKALTFTEKDRRELRYASLLHDFGKVGVRENVLVKANKLFPHELELLERRFEEARRSNEVNMLKRKVEGLERGDLAKEAIAALEEDWKRRDQDFNAMLDFILRCNRPTVLEEGGFEKLQDIAKLTYLDSRGREHKLLSDSEAVNLSIARGSLNEKERREIESHVVHTYNFLRAIPWTRDLSRVPEIAQGHHEKLDGTGYPRGIPALQIPVQTRIMTVSDIYDALTASDRPYKGAVPHPKAMAILEDEAKRGHIDRTILDVFIEAEVPKRALAPKT